MEPRTDILISDCSGGEAVMVSILLDMYHEHHGISFVDLTKYEAQRKIRETVSIPFRPAHMIWSWSPGLALYSAVGRLDSRNRRLLGELIG